MANLPSDRNDPVPSDGVVAKLDGEETISSVGPGLRTPNPSISGSEGPFAIGTLFGRFQMIRVLGQGGMGIVYLASDPKLNRQVALKVMRPEVSSQPLERKRFLREARAAASLTSDHVVVVYEADEIDGVPYIAQQLLTGCTLDEYQNLHPDLPATTIIRFAKEILEGLCVAHRAGMVHRDIKPSNLWIESPSDRVKILDFGLAIVDHSDKTLTQRGSLLGTPSYMSPEQAMGQEVDSTSDLFSVGVVLYRLCVGQLPFVGDSAIGVLHSILHDQPVDVHVRNNTIPIFFSRLIAKLLEKDRSHRFPSATDALAELMGLDATQIMPASLLQLEPKNSRLHWGFRISVAVVAVMAVSIACAILFRVMPNASELREFRDARMLIEEIEKSQSRSTRRISISYDIDVGDVTEKFDPPFVIGVFANLFGQDNSTKRSLSERKFVDIDRGNFEAVLESMEPKLKLTIPDRLDENGSRSVELHFRSMKDFEPSSVANQIPDISQLLELRSSASSQPNPSQSRILAIDVRISSQLREIFQHPDFRRLESTWLGLRCLTHQIPTSDRLKIRVLNVRKKELMDDILLAADSSQTNAFRIVFEREYGSPGGQPYALLIADFEIGNETDELYFLSSLGKVAEYAGAPIVLSAAPNMFGVSSFADLNSMSLDSFEFGSDWHKFRASPEANYVGLTLPRFVARLPFSPSTKSSDSFVFHEPRSEDKTDSIRSADITWMSGVWPFASEVARAFDREGWPARCSGELGGGKIDYLPEVPLFSSSKKSMDVLLSQPRQLSLIRNGFMPFDPGGPDQKTMLLRAQSCGKNSRLNEMLCAASFLRVIRMIARDKMGSSMEIEDINGYFQRWLDNYCIANLAGATDDDRCRRPLLDASVFVTPPIDSLSVPTLHLKVRPHYQFDPPPREAIEFRFPLDIGPN